MLIWSAYARLCVVHVATILLERLLLKSLHHVLMVRIVVGSQTGINGANIGWTNDLGLQKDPGARYDWIFGEYFLCVGIAQ